MEQKHRCKHTISHVYIPVTGSGFTVPRGSSHDLTSAGTACQWKCADFPWMKAIIFWICQFLLALWPLLKSVFFLILERFLIIKLRNVRFFLSFILCDSPRIGPISSFPGWVFVPGSQKVVLTPHHWCSKSGSWADKPHSCFLGLCFIHSRTTLHLWTWSKVKFILNFKKCHCCV